MTIKSSLELIDSLYHLEMVFLQITHDYSHILRHKKPTKAANLIAKISCAVFYNVQTSLEKQTILYSITQLEKVQTFLNNISLDDRCVHLKKLKEIVENFTFIQNVQQQIHFILQKEVQKLEKELSFKPAALQSFFYQEGIGPFSYKSRKFPFFLALYP